MKFEQFTELRGTMQKPDSCPIVINLSKIKIVLPYIETNVSNVVVVVIEGEENPTFIRANFDDLSRRLQQL